MDIVAESINISMTTKNMGQEGLTFFFGEVVDIEDPHQLGRIRVRIFGEHTDIEDSDLNWSMVLGSVYSASSQGVGISPTGITLGTHVMGIYLDGREKQKSLVLGTIAKMPGMVEENNDVSKFARGKGKPETKQLGPEPKRSYAAEYPYNKVISTESGHLLELDDTEGQERINIEHMSGTYTEINKDGRKVDKVVDDHFQIIQGDEIFYVKGNVEQTLKGKLTINIDGQATINSKSKVDIKCTKFTVNGVPYDTLLSMS